MLFDLNNQDAQQSVGPIPAGSKVKVKMTILMPEKHRVGHFSPLLSKSTSTTIEYLRVKLTVVQGSYEGRSLRYNFCVAGAEEGNHKHEAAIDRGKRLLKSILEYTHNISPSDNSEEARAKRIISDFSQFDGVEFYARIGCSSRKDETHMPYVVNTLESVITRDHKDFDVLEKKGEIIPT